MGGKWPFGTLVPSPHYGNMGCQDSKTKKDKKLDRFLKKKSTYSKETVYCIRTESVTKIEIIKDNFSNKQILLD